jgi:hypothetical protein
VTQLPNHLFAPLKLRSVTLPNRIAVSPMCEYSSIDGFANDWHFVHLGSRAIGGAALVLTEASAVSPEARITPSDLGIWSDEHIPQLKRITTFLHQHGSYAGTQLAHAGRKASMSVPWEKNRTIPPSEGGWQPVAPSAIRFDEAYPIPTALDRAGLDKITADFVSATHRALAAGFDSQVTDSSPNFGTDSGAYGERLGAISLRIISQNIIGHAVFAPVFHDDPRYYKMGSGHSIVERGLYAATRTLITRSDDGRARPNYSLLSGNLAAATLTNAYYPRVNQGVAETANTFGTSIGGSAVGFVVTEFLDDVLRLAHLQKLE